MGLGIVLGFIFVREFKNNFINKLLLVLKIKGKILIFFSKSFFSYESVLLLILVFFDIFLGFWKKDVFSYFFINGVMFNYFMYY